MLVKELIESLKYMDQDAEVHFSYNYGDHWRTQVAPRVREVFDGVVKPSDYHGMDKLMDESDMYEEGDYEGTCRVVVLG
jgi:hypothetical protein